MKASKSVYFSSSNVPKIKLCAILEHEKQDFKTEYHIPYASLHYYFYAGVIRIGENEFHFESGDITITPPGIPSRYKMDVEGRHFCVHFAIEPGDIILPVHFTPSMQPQDSLVKLQEILKAYAIPSASLAQSRISQARAQALLQLFLVELAEQIEIPQASLNVSARAIEKLVQYIELNLDLPLNVSELSRECGLSQNYLARKFKDIYGVTIKEYILARRMDRAKYLLKNNSYQIKHVAMLCGIHDPQYFNKIFRQNTGKSPTEYRKSSR